MSLVDASAPPTANPALPLLGQTLRVVLTDGRVLVGRLHCIDWMQNIVLRDTELWRPPNATQSDAPEAPELPVGKRLLGLVSIASKFVVSYEVGAAAAAT